MNARYILTVSDPTLSTTSSGSITFPLDLLIFEPSGPIIRPLFNLFWYGSDSVTAPRSKSTFWKKREYSKCKVVCSEPPKYWLIGIQIFCFSFEENSVSFWESRYRKKYQDESTNVSIVSTSGVQPSPKTFSVLSFNSLDLASGASPVGLKSTSSGKVQGKFSSGTGFGLPSGSKTIGMGVPQYL